MVSAGDNVIPNTNVPSPAAPKRSRWVLRIVLGVAACCALAALGVYGFLRGSLATLDGEVRGNGLRTRVTVTRDALEASSPKLREMLGAQGFGQVSVDISQRSFQERPSQAQSYDWTPSANPGISAATVSAATPARAARGAVDAYA